MTISAEELKALERWHPCSWISTERYCHVCEERWPCVVVRLIEDYRTLHNALAGARQRMEELGRSFALYRGNAEASKLAGDEVCGRLNDRLSIVAGDLRALQKRMKGYEEESLRLLHEKADLIEERDTEAETELQTTREGRAAWTHNATLARLEGWKFKAERDIALKRCKELEQSNVRLREVLRHAEEWMAEDGCDCGVDEPGTCGLCEVRALLELAP